MAIRNGFCLYSLQVGAVWNTLCRYCKLPNPLKKWKRLYLVILYRNNVLNMQWITSNSLQQLFWIHGVKVAEMPLIATCSKYQRHGMCSRLMNAIEEMLKFLKVEKLVVSAIPSLVDTWTWDLGSHPWKQTGRKV